MGSTAALSNASGALLNSYAYEPFGSIRKQTGTTANAWAFTGHPRDAESSLQFLRNRYYDSRTGTFLTQDPIGVAGGVNLYGYASNNPLSRRDPFGLKSVWDVIGDWYHERPGTENSTFDASDQITQDIMRDEGVQRARNAAGRPDSYAYYHDFGIGDYFRELLTGDLTGSFLGSYSVSIERKSGNKCGSGRDDYQFTVKNSTGWESGTRSPLKIARGKPSIEDMINNQFKGGPFTLFPRSMLNNKNRSVPGPGGDMSQTYAWTE